MQIVLLKSKIQQLIVSESCESYPGSISLPQEIIEAAQLNYFEQVHVNNLTNGSRILTYVIPGKSKGFVSINGAASKHFNEGDKIHVLSYSILSKEEIASHIPLIVYTDTNNILVSVDVYSIPDNSQLW